MTIWTNFRYHIPYNILYNKYTWCIQKVDGNTFLLLFTYFIIITNSPLSALDYHTYFQIYIIQKTIWLIFLDVIEYIWHDESVAPTEFNETIRGYIILTLFVCNNHHPQYMHMLSDVWTFSSWFLTVKQNHYQ